jgi:hypothetical protein
VLREVSATQLPERSVRGANVNANRDIVVWSSESANVWVKTGADSTSVFLTGAVDVVSAALDSGGGAIEAVVALAGQSYFVRQSLPAVPAVARRTPLPMRVESATVLAHEWCIVGRRTQATEIRLSCFDRSNGEQKFTRTLTVGDTSARVRVTSAPGLLVITRANAPFDVWSVPRRGVPIIHFRPSAIMGSPLAGAPSRPRWFAIATIAIDSGFIQTVSDVRSDARVMILYDRHGREIRQTVLGTPMAFIALDVAAHELIAVRQSDVREIVRYAWSWQ